MVLARNKNNRFLSKKSNKLIQENESWPMEKFILVEENAQKQM